MLTTILYILSAGILGIFLGAQICEGVLFVPRWKSLPPKDFFEMHKTYGKKIYQFFAPLTIVATVIPVATSIYTACLYGNSQIYPILMGVFTLLFFSTYFLYFKKANASFSEESLSYEELPMELDRWGKWHWMRIVLEFFAFSCSLISLTLI